MREATNMGVTEFTNIGFGGRYDKNTPSISEISDKYSLLRFLNWIKSSLVPFFVCTSQAVATCFFRKTYGTGSGSDVLFAEFLFPAHLKHSLNRFVSYVVAAPVLTQLLKDAPVSFSFHGT